MCQLLPSLCRRVFEQHRRKELQQSFHCTEQGYYTDVPLNESGYLLSIPVLSLLLRLGFLVSLVCRMYEIDEQLLSRRNLDYHLLPVLNKVFMFISCQFNYNPNRFN